MPTSKQEWRRQILASRRELSLTERDRESLELCRAAAESARDTHVVAAYVPVGSEPGSLDLLDALARVSPVVLVPVAREPGPLHWAEYTSRSRLKTAPYGLLEPTSDAQPPERVGDCNVVFIPALAVDRRGVRLGRGAGFYDRTLDLVPSGIPIVAVVRDCELVDRLPEEMHDRRATHALTPSLGLVLLDEE